MAIVHSSHVEESAPPLLVPTVPKAPPRMPSPGSIAPPPASSPTSDGAAERASSGQVGWIRSSSSTSENTAYPSQGASPDDADDHDWSYLRTSTTPPPASDNCSRGIGYANGLPTNVQPARSGTRNGCDCAIDSPGPVVSDAPSRVMSQSASPGAIDCPSLSSTYSSPSSAKSLQITGSYGPRLCVNTPAPPSSSN